MNKIPENICVLNNGYHCFFFLLPKVVLIPYVFFNKLIAVCMLMSPITYSSSVGPRLRFSVICCNLSLKHSEDQCVTQSLHSKIGL